ncbi:MAG: class I SAM-dependent methyltransferase [Actinobacteria bacterium]|nr:class I SAM-dependent methyltransferase [Actinomycetota bacterium]
MTPSYPRARYRPRPGAAPGYRGGVQPPPWNHNIHYHPLIMRAVPPGTECALDVGCGAGLLARELRQQVPHVTAIDRDAPVLASARQQDGGAGIEYLHGDFLAWDFGPEPFDLIVSVAALHHMDQAAALTRMRDLLRPGGALAVVGLARSGAADLPVDLAAVPVNLALRVRHRDWPQARRARGEVMAPVIWPPPHTYREVRQLAADLLPGVCYRRRLLWRYSLIWRKPAG